MGDRKGGSKMREDYVIKILATKKAIKLYIDQKQLKQHSY